MTYNRDYIASAVDGLRLKHPRYAERLYQCDIKTTFLKESEIKLDKSLKICYNIPSY
jgi:hypothetical protein